MPILVIIVLMEKKGMDFLNNSLLFGMKPGLQNMEKLCSFFAHPEKTFRVVHVVGTNGKGSTAFYLSQILKAHGKKVGFYSSPHLVSLQERIRIDGTPISKIDLERLLLEVQKASTLEKVTLTFFEIMTMVCLLYFREQNIEIAVLEAGLGGRLDCTAIAKGELTILTNIGLDHTEVLGNDKAAILNEKLGIISTGQVLVRRFLSTDLDEQASKWAIQKGIKEVIPELDLSIEVLNVGAHYKENASLSLKAAKILLSVEWDRSIAVNALSESAFLGRMQTLKNKNGVLRFILDGAHNLHAMERLTETLSLHYNGKKMPCLFAAVKDKDASSMIEMLKPFVSEWYLTKTSYARFRETNELAKLLLESGIPVKKQATLSKEFLMECERDAAGSPILVTGSLYLIGAVIDILKNDFDSLSFFRGLDATTNEHR